MQTPGPVDLAGAPDYSWRCAGYAAHRNGRTVYRCRSDYYLVHHEVRQQLRLVLVAGGQGLAQTPAPGCYPRPVSWQ
jgi:hypothetical protein